MSSVKNSKKNSNEHVVDINHAKHSRWGWLILLFGVGGFFLWASFAPLDQGVGSPGVVVVSGSRKSVQPLTGGKVAAILVKDGDAVKKDQLLVQMDATQPKAQLEIAKNQWFSTMAVEARLTAERAGKGQIIFPAALLKEKKDSRAANAIELQKQLFETRQRNLRGELAIMAESLAGIESQLKGLEESKKSKDEQLRLMKEEIVGQRELAKEGFLPRNRLLEQERLLEQISGAISEDIGNIGRARRAASEVKARMIARQQDFTREVESQLADVQRDSSSLTSRVGALTEEVQNTEIRSPSAGVVVGQNIHTEGGVVQAGSVLMDIVPKDEPLTIETQIMPNLIDKVKVGLEVDIMFSAFQQSITPHVPGRVLGISADVLVDQKHGYAYYKALIGTTPEGMKKLKDHQVKAGMPVEVFVKTGERTMMNYLIKPLKDRVRNSLTEE